MKKEFGKPILYVECDDKVLMKAFMMQYKFYNELHLQEYRSWPYAVQFTKEQVGQWFLMSPKIMNVKGVRVVGKRDKGLRELYATGKLEDLEVLFKNIFKYLMRRRRRTPDEQKPSVDTAFTTHKIAADRARKRFV